MITKGLGHHVSLVSRGAIKWYALIITSVTAQLLKIVSWLSQELNIAEVEHWGLKLTHRMNQELEIKFLTDQELHITSRITEA